MVIKNKNFSKNLPNSQTYQLLEITTLNYILNQILN